MGKAKGEKSEAKAEVPGRKQKFLRHGSHTQGDIKPVENTKMIQTNSNASLE